MQSVMGNPESAKNARNFWSQKGGINMQFNDIHIRDPFILPDGGRYYLYGSRGGETWGKCTGLDVYVSDDLEHWSEPKEAFTPPEGFWSDKEFWAPEVHAYRGAYYMFVSFKSDARCRGTQILRAQSPEGPFLVHSDGPVTPEHWECLDGTLHVEPDGTPYMVFCHEWVQVKDGEMCAVKLTEDLRAPAGEPFVLFRASEPAWNAPLGGGHSDCYVTDGPFLYRTQDGTLLMIWSSVPGGRYCEAISYSDNGSIIGNWRHDERLLFSEDGGHGMIFRTLEGGLRFIFHQPNQSPMERPHLVALRDAGGTIVRE